MQVLTDDHGQQGPQGTGRYDEQGDPPQDPAYARGVAHIAAVGVQGGEDRLRRGVFLLAPLTLLDLVDAAVRTGRHEQAHAHVTAARTAGLDDVSPRLAMPLHASAALATDDDRHPGFDEAITVEGAERWPFDLARIHLSYGERLRRGRAPGQARRHLGSAAEIFQRLGAAPWADRAGQELRARGSPGRTASTPAVTRSASVPKRKGTRHEQPLSCPADISRPADRTHPRRLPRPGISGIFIGGPRRSPDAPPERRKLRHPGSRPPCPLGVALSRHTHVDPDASADGVENPTDVLGKP